MYEIRLSESSFPARPDGDIRETTVGDLLREVAARSPNAAAIVDIDAHGRAGRTWTYAELLTEAEAIALALSSRFRPGERRRAGLSTPRGCNAGRTWGWYRRRPPWRCVGRA